MDQRGTTRPMAESGDDEHSDPQKMLESHHENTLWVYWTLIMLGVWLILSPFTFGYLNSSLWGDPS